MRMHTECPMPATDSLAELQGCKVMVVEDEPLEALDYCDRLAEAGAEIVGPFGSVSEALDVVDNQPVDVALLDYALADQQQRGVAGGTRDARHTVRRADGLSARAGPPRRPPGGAVKAHLGRPALYDHQGGCEDGSALTRPAGLDNAVIAGFRPPRAPGHDALSPCLLYSPSEACFCTRKAPGCSATVIP